ncbi:MAG TPA: universal stress protein [Candidatus Brocadiales bacterium]|nr:universal stress protein [Candidatus Brocadiales bacterium]
MVPTDFTAFSDQAVEYASVIAKRFDSKIILVHVIEPLTYDLTDTIQVVDHFMALKTIAEPILDNLQKKLLKKGLQAKTFLLKGNPYLEIVEKARKAMVDLIIMGTHGRTGIKHLLMGSVAERVVRLAVKGFPI